MGMCQWGAVGMALAGRTEEQILLHYFPTADKAPAYQKCDRKPQALGGNGVKKCT